jgi:vesicle coat complex subunit
MRHVAHLLADVVKLTGPEDRDRAARRLIESCQSAQQCSFTGAVIAENGVKFPADKFGSDAAQSGKTPKLFDQVRDSDNGDGRGFSQWN